MFRNYEDFYPRSFIPIGESDRSTFLQTFSENTDMLLLATHWFVALEGSPIQPNSHIYHWKVVVYPATADTVFYYDYPHFSSPPIQSFHDASLLAKEIETQIKADEFLSKKQHSLKVV
ncbi:hypothetical protein [Anoxybacteroides tepidamans]|uniref:hypothetical protein n=1 Tax=Anoxybacteroides tepidamans TaxID=265948 RepID=UPI0004826249|nr:hypothetical protein [Anoxybacillus tepidamans]